VNFFEVRIILWIMFLIVNVSGVPTPHIAAERTHKIDIKKQLTSKNCVKNTQ